MSEAKKAYIAAVAANVGDPLPPRRSTMDHEAFAKEAHKWSEATSEFLSKCQYYGIWCRQEGMSLHDTLKSFQLQTPAAGIDPEKQVELAWKHTDRTMR